MKNSDKSNLIVNEANEIIESYLRRKSGVKIAGIKRKTNILRIILAAVLSVSTAVVVFYVIKTI